MKSCFFWMGIILVLSLQSCLVSKKVVYVEDMIVDSSYLALPAPDLRIQKNDRLNIQVSAKNPELAAPFNANSTGAGYLVDEEGNLKLNSTGLVNEYTVNEDGTIYFPVLGKIKVEGETPKDIGTYIKNLLVSQGLINEPMVKVELLNLKIMMMGEVGSAGTMNVPEGRITLLEAINNSGGLSTNAIPDEVMVIREENGVRTMYANDVRSVELFNSPTYYLRQNDIVYVKPRTAKMTLREQQSWRYIGLFTGLITMTLSFIAIFRNN